MLTTSCKGKQPTFSFERRIKFSAHLDLAFAQNQRFVQQLRATAQTDIWQKQPPDFSYKLYKSSRPPQKPPGKEKEELKKVNSTESETKQQLPRIKTSQFHPALERKKELPKLITRFPHVGSYEAEIMFVENGKYKTGMYQDPKPHDFRQYETNIPDFVTSYPRDPFNLKFKSQHLNAEDVLADLSRLHLCPNTGEVTACVTILGTAKGAVFPLEQCQERTWENHCEHSGPHPQKYLCLTPIFFSGSYILIFEDLS